MEKPPEHKRDRVQITKAVFDGLEFIRRSGATNMLDRSVVLDLAREWSLTATADWIERVDSATYGRLIFQGPEVIGDESLDEKLDRLDQEYDEERRGFWEGIEPSPAEVQGGVQPIRDHNSNSELESMRSTVVKLGKWASLAMADAYETEGMGVLLDQAHRLCVNAERSLLMTNLIELANMEHQLEELIAEVERGIRSLQTLIDPENN